MEIDVQARRNLHIAEIDAVVLANLGSVARLEEHSVESKTCHNSRPSIAHPTRVQNGQHIVDGYIARNQQQQCYNEYIARTYSIGKGHCIAETVMDTRLDLREERRSETEEER